LGAAYAIESYGTVTALAFLNETADLAAPQVLGWRLSSDVGGSRTEVALTEVEA
jgi:3-methyladenine DNA glycosylase Mpg